MSDVSAGQRQAMSDIGVEIVSKSACDLVYNSIRACRGQ